MLKPPPLFRRFPKISGTLSQALLFLNKLTNLIDPQNRDLLFVAGKMNVCLTTFPQQCVTSQVAVHHMTKLQCQNRTRPFQKTFMYQ